MPNSSSKESWTNIWNFKNMKEENKSYKNILQKDLNIKAYKRNVEHSSWNFKSQQENSRSW